MTICAASNNVGSCSVSFNYDSHTMETWFETHAAVYTKDSGEKIVKGFYKVYRFKTLKAAKAKFDALLEKHNIH